MTEKFSYELPQRTPEQQDRFDQIHSLQREINFALRDYGTWAYTADRQYRRPDHEEILQKNLEAYHTLTGITPQHKRIQASLNSQFNQLGNELGSGAYTYSIVLHFQMCGKREEISALNTQYLRKEFTAVDHYIETGEPLVEKPESDQMKTS